MATQCFVTGYIDRAVDTQVSPNELYLTAEYLVYEDAQGVGAVGAAPVTLVLTDTPSQQATKIRTAVRDHIQNVITFPFVPLVSGVRIPTLT